MLLPIPIPIPIYIPYYSGNNSFKEKPKIIINEKNLFPQFAVHLRNSKNVKFMWHAISYPFFEVYNNNKERVTYQANLMRPVLICSGPVPELFGDVFDRIIEELNKEENSVYFIRKLTVSKENNKPLNDDTCDTKYYLTYVRFSENELSHAHGR